MSFLFQSVTRLFTARKPPPKEENEDLPPRLRALVTDRYPSIPRHLDLADSTSTLPSHTPQNPTLSHPKLFRSQSSFTISPSDYTLPPPTKPTPRHISLDRDDDSTPTPKTELHNVSSSKSSQDLFDNPKKPNPSKFASESPEDICTSSGEELSFRNDSLPKDIQNPNEPRKISLEDETFKREELDDQTEDYLDNFKEKEIEKNEDENEDVVELKEKSEEIHSASLSESYHVEAQKLDESATWTSSSANSTLREKEEQNHLGQEGDNRLIALPKIKEEYVGSLTENDERSFEVNVSPNITKTSPPSNKEFVSISEQDIANQSSPQTAIELHERISRSTPKFSLSERVTVVMDLVMIYRTPQVVFFASGDTTELWLQRPPPPPVTLFFVESDDQASGLRRIGALLPNNVNIQHVQAQMSESPKWDSELVIHGFDWLLPSTWIVDMHAAHPHISSHTDFDVCLRTIYGLTNSQSTIIVVYQTLSASVDAVTESPQEIELEGCTTVQYNEEIAFSPSQFECFANKRSFHVLTDRLVGDSKDSNIRIAALVHTTNANDDSVEPKTGVAQEEPESEDIVAEAVKADEEEEVNRQKFCFRLYVDSIPREKRQWASRAIIIGSIGSLGRWQADNALRMDGNIHEDGGTLNKSVDIEVGYLPFEYKYAIINDHNHIVAWEEGGDRVVHDVEQQSDALELFEHWRS